MVEWFVGAAVIGVMIMLPWGIGYCVNYRELLVNKSPMNNWLTGTLILCVLIAGLVAPWVIGELVLSLGRISGG